MKLSYNWLKQYLNLNLSPQEVSTILTNTGLEVEGMETFESIKGGLEGLVIGKVATCEKHPNADKLSVTTVDVGNDKLLPIVCGAPNVATGQKVVVATVGTTLYNGDDEFKIKKAKMRGEPSEGMICAEDEIGVGTSHDGIMVLPDEVPIGTPAKEFFQIETDTVFEIGLTPNRIDGASHIGAARDIAAYLNQEKQKVKLAKPEVTPFAVDNKDLPIAIEVENQEACPRYSGLTLSGIQVGPSPAWLQNRLKAIGLNPINNLVDISNFVLHETGHPLHFFDADKIKGNKVVVKNLPEGTTFITLDKQERKLSADDLMICDSEGGMCIAGVFGGIDSGVTEKTQNLFIESAYFHPVSIRKTAKRHGLHTDASFRYERGADPNNTIYALKRAALLVKELAGGTISSDIVDVYPKPIEDFHVRLTFANLQRLSGIKMDTERLKNILYQLDIQITGEDKNGLDLTVPTYRADVQREVDVIEEILRIFGFNSIPTPQRVEASVNPRLKPDKDQLFNLLADQLVGSGFNEIMCNSLTKDNYYKQLRAYPENRLVNILNPLSSDLNVMRQTLLFGGLESVQYNLNRRKPNLRLFELGNCYFYDENQRKEENPHKAYSEQTHLALFLTGDREEENWRTPQKETSFFQMKTYVINLLERIGVKAEDMEEMETSNDIFIEGLTLTHNSKPIAELGIISKKIIQPFGLEEPVYYADINWDVLMKVAAKNQVVYQPIAKYPEVRRDLALLLDKQVRFKDIKALATKTERKLLKRIALFDVYEGEKLGNNKKSYAISFILQDENKTLKDKQIDKIMQRLTQTFEQELGAQLR
ncbi:MAG: phenylalanine--tRNA ligase subunit beta [Bacteroidota bacterium]